MEAHSAAQKIEEFRRGDIRAYEESLARAREENRRLAESQTRKQREIRDILSASEVDLRRIDQMEVQSKVELEDMLSRVRPALAKRARDHSITRLQLALMADRRARVVNVAESLLLAPSADDLEGNEGERGNPWVLPWPPGPVHLRQTFTGSGSGWGAYGQNDPTEAIFYYFFVPDQTSVWQLWELTDLSGFYIVRADDGSWTSKNAEVRVTIEMDVFQYFWNGAKRDTVINREGDNISEGRSFQRLHRFEYPVFLKERDGVWVRVKVSAFANASGDGSYAEINFRDGNSNYIDPVVLLAWI